VPGQVILIFPTFATKISAEQNHVVCQVSQAKQELNRQARQDAKVIQFQFLASWRLGGSIIFASI
jgi:hypothetical protein